MIDLVAFGTIFMFPEHFCRPWHVWIALSLLLVSIYTVVVFLLFYIVSSVDLLM